ncbi:hypothetical protein tb265_09500 [Gemmatimonadetes bacterium T265]|nr:hypothetical protein tb265_09500 [Gemmatimonadetes bacterium T265]
MPNVAPDAPPLGPPPPDALTAARWRRAQAAFYDAVDRAPASRAAALAAACAGDDALRRMVEHMLDADAHASAALGALPAALGPLVGTGGAPDDPHAADPTACAGRQVGVYRLLRELGRGGMGTVYLAERPDVARRVALKLVRGGLAAPDRVARFRVEQRVLARLDHPHIARLFDAGVADDGTPFFAMEYVDGEPIDRYCDRHRLPVAARLRLVEQACAAVAFAHRNLVVHRDLKPGNLLVTASGEVRLLDFGIAKLLAPDAPGPDTPADGTPAAPPLTEAGVRWMTPEYAAPEQAGGGPVTTATDVYALGVIAYELLAGSRPGRGALGAGDRLPTRPSAAARAARRGAATPAEVAAARGATPAQLTRQLAGDLDAIVLTALDPDPARRYASAAELLDDLRRQRTGFPVRARPDGAAYRARLFVRRNRWGVGAAAGAVALLAGTAAALAVAQARTATALARATAEAAKAREVTRFVATLFQDADPYRTGTRAAAGANGPAATPTGGAADALLGIGAVRIERELARQPAARVELLGTLGMVQRNLGRYAAADALFRRGIAARRALIGPGVTHDAELGTLLYELGSVRRLETDLTGADTLLTQALAIRQALRVSRADLDATLFQVGGVRRLQGRFAEAARLLESVIAAEADTPGPTLADALDQLAAVRIELRDADSAATIARQAVALRERLEGPEHLSVALAYMRLSVALRNGHHIPPAERAIRRALAIQRRRLPAEHPHLLQVENELGVVLIEAGAYAEADRILRHVLRVRERTAPESRDHAATLYALGDLRARQGDFAGAVDFYRRAIAGYARLLGPDNPDVNTVREVLAPAEAERGHEADALAVTARLLAARRVPVWDPVAQPLDALGALLRDGGDCRHAAPLARRALAAYLARHPAPAGAAPGDTLPAHLRAAAAACGAARR